MKRILSIWLPNWPIQRLTAARPELKDRAVVLHETRRGTGRVVSCSVRAGQLGVAVGMPLAEVAALAGVSALHLESSERIADREHLEALAESCGRFSPIVGIEESANPDCLLLDITGLAHLFGGEASLAQQVLDDFARRGLTVRIAIAETIGAAWAVAHYQRGQGSGVRGQDVKAPLFTAGCPLPTAPCPLPPVPCPLTIIPPGKVSAALGPLPVAALRLPEETVGTLHQLGIHRIGQLEALARDGLQSRFGRPVTERLDQATGRRAEILAVGRLLPGLKADCSLEYPTSRQATVELTLERLIGRLAKMLGERGHGAMRLECRLDCLSSRPVPISVGLFRATASPQHLLALVLMQLERLRLPSPVAAVHVEATATAPLEQRQQEMFFGGDGSSGLFSRLVAGLVDRLSSRLGRKLVLRVRLASEAQPELAYRYEPLVGSSAAGRSRRRPRRQMASADLPPRPLQLLPRPILLAATSIIPEGPPLRFHLWGCQHRIAQSCGPERIETGWWRSRPVGRDYYRVETTTGRRFWLFRRLGDGRWFVHGMFE